MRCHAAGCGRSALAASGPLAQQQAGVACSLYDLRHTFASWLLAAGIPLIEVSVWMGHGLRAGGHEIANTTTRVYANATGESRQAPLDELAALIETPIRNANSDMNLSDPHNKLTRRMSIEQLPIRLRPVGFAARAARSGRLRPAKR